MARLSTPNPPVTYAVGDLHGEISLLRRLLARLPLRDRDTLVFLGDYLHRGEDSRATIAALRDLERTHRGCVFLRGNHEDAWLDHWDGTRFERWPEIAGARGVWDAWGGAIPTDVGRWLAATRIEYEDEHGFYVHAGLLPGEPPRGTPDDVKLWGEPAFLRSDADWGRPVVFGHWELREPLLRSEKIGVDTGAWRTGVLTAVRLPDRAIFQARR